MSRKTDWMQTDCRISKNGNELTATTYGTWDFEDGQKKTYALVSGCKDCNKCAVFAFEELLMSSDDPCTPCKGRWEPSKEEV